MIIDDITHTLLHSEASFHYITPLREVVKTLCDDDIVFDNITLFSRMRYSAPMAFIITYPILPLSLMTLLFSGVCMQWY